MTPNSPRKRRYGPSSRQALATPGNESVVEIKPDSTKVAFASPDRMKPAIPFDSAKGSLTLPAQGKRIKRFGDADEAGGTIKGISLQTRPEARITAPSDGWVVYAGPFRSYGQLLIINTGGGYHVLLAGMSRIDASLGQFVLTGEPVAVMGAPETTSQGSNENSRPVLYVEFRKDGKPIDPDPWWAAASEKVARIMRKSEYALWTLLVLAVLAAGSAMVALARSQTASAANSEIYRQLDLFGEVLERVRADYVEKPDDSKLIESAINGMLTALDPHSAYLNPKHFRDMQVQTRGEFGGLGIEVTMENGVVKVVSPIEDTPASKAGLQSGDLITALDKEQIQGLTLQEAVEKMRGPVNSPITLTIVRKGVDDPFDVKVTRDVIHINPVKYNAEDDVGYIRVTTFNEQTTANLQKAIDELKKQIGPKLKGYIIDLRNNPGGLLDQAISVSDTFLDQGAIVLTKGRDLEETQRSNARAGDLTDGQEARRADQWRLGLGFGDRRRRVAGSSSRDHHRHALFRQGLGADHHSARLERRAAD